MARTAGSRADQTRARILLAAWELFEERGYASTSIRDIADHVGITKAALYYHFPAKQDILDARIMPLVEGVDAITESASGERPVDRERVLRSVLELFTRASAIMATDPSALKETSARLDIQGRFLRLQRALAGGDDLTARLAVACALGAIHAGVTTLIAERSGHNPSCLPEGSSGAPNRPTTLSLTHGEFHAILAGALAAWNSADNATDSAAGKAAGKAAEVPHPA
jgi:AcrR family transcriptional regulator